MVRVEPMTVRRVRTSWAAILIVGAVLATGCHATPPAGQTGPVLISPLPSLGFPSAKRTVVATAPTDESADNAVDRVIAISIDGLNPRAIEELGPSRTPAFHRLMREGAYTLNARTVREQTHTLPNHIAMLTGRRVDDEHGGHGYTENFDNGSTVHQAAGHYVASVFDVVHDHGDSTALFASKRKFDLYERTWNTHGRPDPIGRNDGRAKIDRFTVDGDNTRLVAKFIAELRRSPREFTFVHLSLPDRIGHSRGFMGKRYLDAVEHTDRLLGRILDAVAARPALRRHTLVLLTADHGGSGGPTHDAPSDLQNFRIPFMAWGPGVAPGRNLYGLNPDFRSPGDSRSSYRGKQPIRNADLANLVTDALDLPRVPGSEFDSPRTLNVFR
jgi:predicted AlkP superfamily pyrophosphatase or phosphodiesterase